jgi:ubiquinone/menaquinone biosynthesis C-methylase UbiE
VINYRCSKCKSHLSSKKDLYICPECNIDFKIVDGIPNLDFLQSAERLVFDQMYSTQEHLTEIEVSSAKFNAANLVEILGIKAVQNYEILEIAAGRGELTVGLFLSPKIQESNIYCFDHSIQSMQILANTLSTVKSQTSNAFYPSIQDVNSMAFADPFFDLIVGNAALHHFLDFDKVVESCLALLKPGGKMLFTEPFLSGYLLVTRIWIQVYEEFFGDMRLLDSRFILNGNLGYLGFIVNDIRIRSGRERTDLEKLTDKHLFIESDFQKIADLNNVHVAFYEYSTEMSARDLMNSLLDTYMITDSEFRMRALSLWDTYVDLAGKSFYGLDSYFKTIVFTKPINAS